MLKDASVPVQDRLILNALKSEPIHTKTEGRGKRGQATSKVFALGRIGTFSIKLVAS